MRINAELNYLRMSPRKVRLVARTIRGKDVLAAERTLRFITRSASRPILKLLKSAVANAKHNFQILSPEALTVSEITVNEGPTLKRRRARAMGRAFPIRKRTSRIRLVLESHAEPTGKKSPKKSTPHAASSVEKIAGGDTGKTTAEREVFRFRPKVRTKTTDFVRRMFRRKAI